MRAADVRGAVVAYPDGAPLAGVQVLVRDARGASFAATTALDGTFAVAGLPAGGWRVQARPPDTMNRMGAYWGDVSSFCAARIVRAGPDDAVEIGAVELPVGGIVEGIVLDAAGAPSPAAVQAAGVGLLEAGLLRSADAGADGAFSLVGLASWVDADGAPLPGAYRVSAALPGEPPFFAPSTWDVAGAALVPAVRGGTTVQDLQRPPGATLRGAVADEDGAPRAGVEIAAWADGFGVVGIAWTDADGRFLLGDVPGAALRVRVAGPGLPEVFVPGGATPDWEEPLPGGGEVELGVLTVPPAAGLRIALAGSVPDTVVVLVGPAKGPRRSVFATVSGGVASIVDLVGGDARVDVSAAGWLGASADVVLAPGATADLSVALTPARVLRASVTARSSGLPVRGARLLAFAPGVAAPLAEATTGADGGASLFLDPAIPVGLGATWTPFCGAEPGLAPAYSGGARAPAEASEAAEGSSLALPPDGDRDGVDDVWEWVWGLDPRRVDAGEDPDGDGASNHDEYVASTDPRDAGSRLGCAQARASLGLPAAVLALSVVGRRRRV